jgi:serine/threonine protein kinase
MWALGVLMYILLSGYHPFDPTNNADDDEVGRRIVKVCVCVCVCACVRVCVRAVPNLSWRTCYCRPCRFYH